MGLRNLSSKAVIGRYYEALEETKDKGWPRLVGHDSPSTQETETYNFTGMTPQLREWVSGRQAKGLLNNERVVRNKHFEATIEVTERERKGDKTTQVDNRIQGLAMRANVHHWESLVSTLIENGESSTCYDGQFFFDTDHSEGDSGSQSNDIGASATSATAPTADEFATAILAAIAQMFGFVDDQGEPINQSLLEFVVMVPNASFWAPAAQAISKNMLNTGSGVRDNPLKNMQFTVRAPILNPRLTWPTKFAIFGIDGQTKPFMLQSETEPDMKAKAEGSDYEFDTGNHEYGVDAWRNADYFMWQKSTLVTFS